PDLERISACRRSKVSFLQLRRLHANNIVGGWWLVVGGWRLTRDHQPPTTRRQSPSMQVINYKSKVFKGSLRQLLLSDLNELWQLDMRCFVDGEAYDRETFRNLLSSPDASARQIRSKYDEMSAFAVAVIEEDRVGNITTVG